MRKRLLSAVCTLLMSMGALCGMLVARTIEFDTRQVTQPDVAISPDGKTLIFTMLGHLFRLPVVGGSAEQLTFGPYYDTDPAISPDGTRVAFVSDRDGSESNIFVLDLSSKQVLVLTKEARAGRPAWSPDGQAIAYLRFEPRYPSSTTAVVRRVSLNGGEAETISSPPRQFGSLFYMPDGRLVWTIAERDSKTSKWRTRVEAVDQKGEATTLATIDGLVHCVLPSPAGNGLYFRRQGTQSFFVQIDEIVLLSLPDGVEKSILPATGGGACFAVASGNKTLYLGQAGRLWKVMLPEGARLPIPLQTHVKLEVAAPTRPPVMLTARSSAASRVIMMPRLTPDGKTLIFGAAGYLWRQPLAGSKAERISSGDVYEDSPSISPDGNQLAFLRVQGSMSSVMVYNLKTQQIRTIVSEAYHSDPFWSRDSRKLIFGEFGDLESYVVSVPLADGKKEQLIKIGMWGPHPNFSADGLWLYYTSDKSGTGQLYRVSLKEKGKAEMLTHLSRHVSDGLISLDGKWLAFRRNKEIWIAPFGSTPVTDNQARLFSAEGGDSFTFASDSSALIYSNGNNVWRQPLVGGKRTQIPVRLDLPLATPKPLLLRGVRMLDFETSGFGTPTSMLIEQGRIAWIGPESGRQIPRDTEVIDCTGRFAIPGLFDFHVYTAGRSPTVFLAYGVTSVRDMEGNIFWMNAMRDRSEFTGDPVPRYFFSGGMFEGEHPEWGDSFLQIYDAEGAREYVRRFKEWGADFIELYSVYTSLPWPLQRIVADEAHQLGLPIVANVTDIEEVTKGVTLGYFSLEFGDAEHVYDDVVQMLSLSGTRWDPVMALSGADAMLLRDEPQKLADPKLRSLISEQALGEALYGSSYKNVNDISLRGYMDDLLARVGEAYRHGVKLNAGTGAPEPECFIGQSLHWELARFVQAGLTPLEVLRIATEEAAAAVGAGDLGTLAPGKIADVVLLNADPLKDIHNTETIWRVIKGGWLFDPDKLSGAQSDGAVYK